jgi:acyl-CoA synthetase (AMP-forming)/AMP-acid ligase II
MRSASNPEFTYHGREAERREIEREGFVTLGDMGYLDGDGFLYLCDRKRDMVISGGVNIYPAEIEAELVTLPGVADCAVFGIPDAEFGETLMAVVEVGPRDSRRAPQPTGRLQGAEAHRVHVGPSPRRLGKDLQAKAPRCVLDGVSAADLSPAGRRSRCSLARYTDAGSMDLSRPGSAGGASSTPGSCP